MRASYDSFSWRIWSRISAISASLAAWDTVGNVEQASANAPATPADRNTMSFLL
jgi:hypothetical protein